MNNIMLKTLVIYADTPSSDPIDDRSRWAGRSLFIPASTYSNHFPC